jgi:hypothetical protein
LTLGGYVDNYANEAAVEQNAEALADPGVVMSCFTAEQVPVLSALAREFAVCDRWFSSMPGPTWPNRFFLHAATSGGLDRSPTAMETVRSQFGGYQFENGSIYEALDRAGLDWRIYHGDPLPQVSALSVMDLDTMRRHYRRTDDLHKDLQEPDFAAAYVFIEPNYGLLERPLGDFQCGNSQHPNDDVARGDAFVKQVYEAIRQSPHWESSLLVVTYDEHGGFYDHVPPPAAVPPGDVTDPDNNGNGFRSTCWAYGFPRSWSRRGYPTYARDSAMAGPATSSTTPNTTTPRYCPPWNGCGAADPHRPGRGGERLPASAGGGATPRRAVHVATSRGLGLRLRGPARPRGPPRRPRTGRRGPSRVRATGGDPGGPPRATGQVPDRRPDRTITTKGEAVRFLVEVAAKLRAAGLA